MSFHYVPVSQVAAYNEVEEARIKALLYHDRKELNGLRFKQSDDGKLLCVLDYKYPLRQEIEKLFHRCIAIAGSEYALCKDLSKKSGIKVDTLHRYFYRFSFKRIKEAKRILQLLEEYQGLSLFKEELDE